MDYNLIYNDGSKEGDRVAAKAVFETPRHLIRSAIIFFIFPAAAKAILLVSCKRAQWAEISVALFLASLQYRKIHIK